MALRDWIGADAGTLDGGSVSLRPPRMSDYKAWADLRAASRDFLQPWEPTWANDDLTRGAFRRRLSLYTRDRDLGLGHAFLAFEQGTRRNLVGGVNLRGVTRGVAQSAAIGYWAGQSPTFGAATRLRASRPSPASLSHPGASPDRGGVLHR